MNKYKIISIILSVISLALLGGMLYLVYGKDSQEPKSKEVTTTTTETTTTTSTTEETTTKVSETQQIVAPQVQVTTSFVAAPVAPPVETTRTVVHFGKSYPIFEGGKMASNDQYELRAKYAELERQNEAKQPTGLGGANLDG